MSLAVPPSASLKAALAETAAEVEQAIRGFFPHNDSAEAVLFEAMGYGCLNGGKRLRPFLVLESARLCGVQQACALRAAVAIEFVHSYSLIHDDLPAMDDSDLRRGNPTVHRQFASRGKGDAIAILAGDGLLTWAFEILADPATHEDPNIRCHLIAALAHAAGPHGMVGGQMLDLIAETWPDITLEAITRLQRLKTGALISFSATAGAILGRADPAHLHALKTYAHDLGLAFQIADDILDATSDPETLGKPVGQDAIAGKATFVSILGLERAREQALFLAEQACGHLDVFGAQAANLRELATYVVVRDT